MLKVRLMFSYMDSVEFYIFFLAYVLMVCCLTTLYYLFRVKKPKIQKGKFIVRFFLISAFTIYLLDSLPYSIMSVRDIPGFYMNLSMIVWLLLGYSTVIYELSKFEPKTKVKDRLK